jgi:hypothetical protein
MIFSKTSLTSLIIFLYFVARGSVVGWGTKLQAGSIPDEVIGFFNWPNPCSSTMALGSAQPLTEMNTGNLPGGKGRPARGADNRTAICEPIVWKMREPRHLTSLWAFTACYRDSFTFFISLNNDVAMVPSEKLRYACWTPKSEISILSKPVLPAWQI